MIEIHCLGLQGSNTAKSLQKFRHPTLSSTTLEVVLVDNYHRRRGIAQNVVGRNMWTRKKAACWEEYLLTYGITNLKQEIKNCVAGKSGPDGFARKNILKMAKGKGFIESSAFLLLLFLFIYLFLFSYSYFEIFPRSRLALLQSDCNDCDHLSDPTWRARLVPSSLSLN